MRILFVHVKSLPTLSVAIKLNELNEGASQDIAQKKAAPHKMNRSKPEIGCKEGTMAL
jgi:hypothetical protein